MASISANDLTKTYYCKQPGCENESSSPVGRYSYCGEHRGQRAGIATPTPPRGTSTQAGAEGALRDLIAMAKKVDKAKAKAATAQRTANEANRKADALQAEYADALAQAARGSMSAAA